MTYWLETQCLAAASIHVTQNFREWIRHGRAPEDFQGEVLRKIQELNEKINGSDLSLYHLLLAHYERGAWMGMNDMLPHLVGQPRPTILCKIIPLRVGI